ncbi:Lethal(2) giant larvae sro7 [Madurella fahalii]|uniref:Lethal(2) giant larvae sro7 n=1 Tax=Madurella fahalii TaxID=1157608 RepID=A0ABQ0GIH9_9PEZI
MASFLRARQAGIQNDLSAGITPGSFAPDEQSRYGINSQISCLAYEPVQSLLAAGTNESQYGPGKIYVFGHRRVYKTLAPPSPPRPGCSIRHLSFVTNRLVSLDSHGELAVWDLDAGRLVAKTAYPRVGCVITDPGLDWALVGLQNGDVCAYDLDRERQAAFRLPNFWRERETDPSKRVMMHHQVGLVGMQLHPRDIGKLLIGYTHGAVVYSFKQNVATQFLEYEIPAGAPGGDGRGVEGVRRPRLTHAVWHPTGTFVLTAHEDGSLVFWDAKEGKLVAARSLYETRVNEPTRKLGKPTPLVPFVKVAWCCKKDPDNTGLLVAGGYAADGEQKGLTFLELGPTPIYATSSWEVLSNHFEGKGRLTLPTPPGAEVVDFCLIPRSSPHFGGAQDPIAILAMLSSGEVVTMSFPSGHPISPTNMLHPSLSFVHPFVQKIAVSTIPREKWLGLTETRDQGDPILLGGAPASKRRKLCNFRNIIQVAHADSTIRIWDVGFDDDIENPGQLQVDVAKALDRFEDVSITALAMAEHTPELAAGTRTGEVVIYRWGTNVNFGRDATKALDPNPGGLTDISSRAERLLKEGMQPFVLYEMMQGPITALRVSDVGFIGVGSEGGFFSIIDLRGPSIILQASLTEFVKEEKRSSFLGGRSKAPATREFPTVIEFGVMTLEGDSYSSIGCFVGTNLGHVATFKLLPAGQAYSAKLTGVAKVGGDKVVAICPVNSENGQAAAATGPTVAGLRQGKEVHGVLVVVTQTEIRVFKPATAKGASRSFDDQLCDAARVAEFPRHGVAVVAVFGDRTTRAYSLPGLKEIGRANLPMLDPARTISAVISRTGEVFGWTGPSEISIIPVWGGSGKGIQPSDDVLINPQLSIPPRPTISNLQWISGTQYVSPTDLDLLIGGEGRPPSKRMMDAAAAERGLVGGAGGAGAGRGASQEGWGEYLTRQLNERTEKLTMVDDAMNKLQETSQGWAEDVSKYVKKQKRDALLGGVKKSFF